MQEMSRSETTKQVKQPSPYRLIRYHLRNLHSDIEGEEWRQASQDLQRLEQAVSMEIGRTGQEATDLHEMFFHTQTQIDNPEGLLGYNPYIQKKICRERVNEIVNKLSDYGVFLGQKITVEGKSQEELYSILQDFNNKIDNLSVHFVEQEVGKDEILGVLKRLRQTVSRYSVEGKDVIRLKRYLLHSVSKTLAAMNAVNLEQPGKLTFKNFAESAAEMHHLLNGFLLALDDPLYRRQLLQEIKERKKEKEEGDGTDYVTELGEDQEVREALKDLIDEVMEERESEDNP